MKERFYNNLEHSLLKINNDEQLRVTVIVLFNPLW